MRSSSYCAHLREAECGECGRVGVVGYAAVVPEHDVAGWPVVGVVGGHVAPCARADLTQRNVLRDSSSILYFIYFLDYNTKTCILLCLCTE